MPIPSEIAALVAQLNQELKQTEQEATEGVNIVRPILSRFPDNIRLIQFFTFFSNALHFVEISKRRIQANVERVSVSNVTVEDIQEAEEDLTALLRRLLEAKMSGKRILEIVKELR